MMPPFVEVVPEGTIRRRVEELGGELADAVDGSVPVLVGVLNGAVPFLADLVRAMPVDLEVEFIALTRFGHHGRVAIDLDTERPLEGRHVVIVEDIVDTGLTLTSLRRLVEARGASEVRTVALVDKRPRRIVDVPLEHRGFEVGDEFLLGYGLDWEGRYRNLRSLWAVLDLARFREEPDALASEVFGTCGARR